ncbi:prephenate dehydrogenase [bacterium]|nr:prephenate dehydrogenase [bacterium]MCP5462988.1 prephenate dehydrogenase [bacterium]
MFKKITIIGMGLMGGSLGKAIIKYIPDAHVIGIVRRQEAVQEVLTAKAAHECTMSYEEGLHDADLVVLSLPVLAICACAESIVPHLKKGAVLTDMGSTKQAIIEKMREIIGKDRFFVGSHPIAGSEKTGVAHSSQDLFLGSVCIVTSDVVGTFSHPLAHEIANEFALRNLRSFWEKVGCRVSVMSSNAHDCLLSAVSHVPHFLSVVLMHFAGDIVYDNQQAVRYTGPGFRDTTRLAGGSPELWADIALTNKHNVLEHLNAINQQINTFLNILQKNDKDELVTYLSKAKKLRENSMEESS